MTDPDAATTEAVYDDDYEDDTCPECEGLGTDKWCDHILPCPVCGGERL